MNTEKLQEKNDEQLKQDVAENAKKPYEKPMIKYSAPLESRAGECTGSSGCSINN